MKMKEYLVLSSKTEKRFPEGLHLSQFQAELLHHAIGLETEVGELQDAIKKNIIYGKELDVVNLIEEAGDILWYLAGLLRTLDTDFESAGIININKLKARYGGKFTEEAALHRDLEKERNVLENNIPSWLTKPVEEMNSEERTAYTFDRMQ